MLQANAIVWVEGPSDRLYFNRWIELITGGAIQEGTHFQCVFYGGRLLAHLSGAEPFAEHSDQAVRLFRINRNAIIVIDSDRSENGSPLNSTKIRIITEIEALGGIAWVTAGREMENYIPNASLRRRFPELRGEMAQYDDIADFLERFRTGEGRRFERNKVLFAESILPLMERADLWQALDLESRIGVTSKAIAQWNNIDCPWINSA